MLAQRVIALSGLRSLTVFPESATSEASGATANARAADPAQTLALRRYLFALSLAAVADSGVWDLREGCILVRNGPPPSGDLSDGEAPITATEVGFDGEERPFAVPRQIEIEEYLKAAAQAFFGSTPPKESSLTFDPAGARAAIDTKRGGGTPEPKTKKDLVAALVALPEYSGKETELNKEPAPKLRKLWRAKQAPAAETEDSGGSESESSPTQV